MSVDTNAPRRAGGRKTLWISSSNNAASTAAHRGTPPVGDFFLWFWHGGDIEFHEGGQTRFFFTRAPAFWMALVGRQADERDFRREVVGTHTETRTAMKTRRRGNSVSTPIDAKRTFQLRLCRALREAARTLF